MAFSHQFSREELSRSLHSAADKLGIGDFHQQQRSALEAFLRGHDVFVNLPTGFGKSMIFLAAPFCWDFLRQSTGTIAIVISPLTALMKDQLDSLKRRGIAAACLTRDTDPLTKSAINRGLFSLIFASPEAMSVSARALLSSPIYKKNLCGIFVDESHCVKKWGFADNKVKAFRSEYSHLGELRSIVSTGVPVVALTATATVETRRTIVKSLGLRNEVLILESPRRDNIKFVVIKTKEIKIFDTFNWLLNDLMKEGKEFNRTIIYCRTKAQCNTLYAKFDKAMKQETAGSRLFAKFHAQTDEDIKTAVLEDFKSESSCIRVLFATVAFGMGIDVQGIHTVFHYGPPHDIEEFIQEAGRAGRDGKPSVSVLVHYPGAARLTRPNKSIKDFIAAATCRRSVALSQFEGDNQWDLVPHKCCDICAAACDCSLPDCKHRTWAETGMKELQSMKELQPTREVPASKKTELQECLIMYREKLLIHEHYLAGGDITSGLPHSTTTRIAEECNFGFSYEQFTTRYPLYNNDVAKEIYTMVEDMLKDCAKIVPVAHFESSSSSESEVEEECIQRPLLFSSSSDSD